MALYNYSNNLLSKPTNEGLKEEAFDFRPIFSYSRQDNVNENLTVSDTAANRSSKDHFVKVIEAIIITLSHILVFFTLPVTVWFCFKTLPQWERLIVYRMGKLMGVKGPGTVFAIPWIDSYHVLDLRTKIVQSPLQQFITQDRAIFEAGCDFHYRIADPLLFVSNYCDPKLQGLQKLAQAIAYKRMMSKEERDLQRYKKGIEDEIVRELNSITTTWGIEMNSVEFTNLKQISQAQVKNPLGSLFKQLESAMVPQHPSVMPAKEVITNPKEAVQHSDCLVSQLQTCVNRLNLSPETNLVIRLEVQTESNVQYLVVQCCRGRGVVLEEETTDLPINAVVKIRETTLHSFLNGATSNQMLQAYLSGEILVDGDPSVLAILQQCFTKC